MVQVTQFWLLLVFFFLWSGTNWIRNMNVQAGRSAWMQLLSEEIQATFIYGNESDMNVISANVPLVSARQIGYSLVPRVLRIDCISRWTEPPWCHLLACENMFWSLALRPAPSSVSSSICPRLFCPSWLTGHNLATLIASWSFLLRTGTKWTNTVHSMNYFLAI